VINTSDLLRLSSSGGDGVVMPDATDPRITRTRLLADEVNAIKVGQAMANGESLTPTVANAARLGLYDTSGHGMPVKFPDTDLASLGFGVNAVQGIPQWIDALGDSRIRLNYYNARVTELPETYRLGPDATVEQLRQNAEAASGERNTILDETRTRISQQGLDFSQDLKAKGITFDQVVDRYARRLGEDPNSPGIDTYRNIIEASGKSNATVTNVAKALVGVENGLNMVAKPLAVVGAGLDGYSLGTEINQSINTGNWQNTGREAARITGGWTGAWTGAEAGASGGAALGLFAGPFAPIAVPALSLIGGLGGGIVGYWLGGKAGQNVYNYANQGR
jgi:hypothetical protein